MRQQDIDRFWSKVQRGDGCWEWQAGLGSFGYAVFWLEGRQERAARVALRLTGVDITGLFVCHHCDNPPCVRPDHLYAGTHADNMRDRMARGRTARGDRMPHQRVHGSAHPRAKLTEADVVAIRARYRPGLGGVLMREYGITQSSMSNIVRGKSWRHIASVTA